MHENKLKLKRDKDYITHLDTTNSQQFNFCGLAS